jgi:hypothetical protein
VRSVPTDQPPLTAPLAALQVYANATLRDLLVRDQEGCDRLTAVIGLTGEFANLTDGGDGPYSSPSDYCSPNTSEDCGGKGSYVSVGSQTVAGDGRSLHRPDRRA